MTINAGSSTGGTPTIPFSQETTFASNQVLMFDTTLNAFVNTALPTGATSGEINTGSNIGAGQGVFKDKLGVDMRFKTIVAGSGIAVTSDTDEVFIAATNSSAGDITGGTNTGSGNGIFKDKVGANLRFRSLSPGTNITLTQNADNIVVAASTNALTLNSIADTGYVKVANNLSDVTAATARTNLAISSTAEADARYLNLDTSKSPTVDNTTVLGDTTKRFNTIYARQFVGNATSATTATSLTGFTPANYLAKAGGTMTGALVLSGAPTIALHAATKAYVDTATAALIDSAPGVLNTLNELAAAIGDDANFATTMSNSIATKLPLAGGTLTGALVLAGAPTIALHPATKAYADTGDALKLAKASNLSDLANAATARTNLGLGTAATTASTAYLATGTLTTNVAEGTNKYYTDARFDTRLGTKTTANLTENTNLYFTTARAKAAAVADAIVNAVTDVAPSQNAVFDALALKEGTIAAGTAAQYYKGNKTWATLNTAAVPEVTNLYYTDARADARIVASSLTAHSNVDAAGASDNGKVLYYNHATTSFKWKDDASTPAGYNNTNWDTAYGYGNHASAGYLTSISANGINDTHIDWGTGTNQVSTADIPEATNLYYTNARADARIAAADTGDLSEGSNLYYTDARADARVAAGSINNLVEDTTPQLGGTLDANSNTIDMGTNIITDAKVGYWDTVYATSGNYNAAYIHSQAAHAPSGAEVNQNAFTTIAVSGQSNVVADAKTDTLTLVAGSNVTLTTTPGTDSVTIASAMTPAANSINDTHIDWGTGANQVSTADIPEATNLYYTDARANSAFDTRLATKTTANLTENTNLYFTNARADARITAAVGTTVQGIDADLTAIGALAKTDGNFIVANGSTWVAEDAATARTSLGLGTMATALTSVYYTKVETDARFANVVGTGNNLADLADAAVSRTNLGLGTAAVANTTAFADTTLSNLSNYTTARTNLGTIGLPEGDARYVRLDVNYAPTVDNTIVLGDTTKRFNTIYARQFVGQISGDFASSTTTDGLTEGSTNLYYTNARADARAQLKIDSLIDSAPGALDTLNELAAALGDDANYAATVTTALATKEPTLAAGTTAQYYKGNKTWATLDTAAVAENTNLYFTNARADARADVRIAASSLTAHTNVDAVIAADDAKVLYYNHATTSFKWKVDAGGHTTTDTLTEGSTNLYYTDARVDTRVGTKSVDILADVDTTTAAPTANQVLTWNSGSSKWVPATQTGTPGGSGEVNDGANVGSAGVGIYDGKVSATLNFRKLNSLDANLTIVDDAANDKIDFDLNSDVMLISQNLAGVTVATARTNLGVGESDSPIFGGVGSGFMNVQATPSAGPVAPTSAAISLVNMPVPSGSGHKWVANHEGDGDLTFSYFTINDAGGNTSSAETYLRFDTTGTKYVSIAGTGIRTYINGLFYPSADGTAGQVLSTDGSGTLSWIAAGSGSGDITAVVAGTGLTGGATSGSATLNVDVGTTASKIVQLDGSAKIPAVDGSLVTGIVTTNVTEGTNLYYTDARADARAQLKVDALIASAPGALDTLNELAAAIGDDANFSTTMTNALAGKEPTITAAANTTYYRGDKTFQALNTTAVAEGTNLYYTNARADARIVAAGSANWNTAYGYGNHASAGYLTSIAANSINDTHIDWGTGANQVSTADVPEQTNLYYTDARADARIGAAVLSALSNVHTAAPTDGQVLKWDNGNSRWAPAADAGGIALTDLSVTTSSPLGAGSLTYNSGTGVFNITMPDLTVAANSINDTHIDWGTGANQVSTADIPEATNLYYTNARADARIGAAALSALSNVHTAAPTDGQVLKWDNGNSRWAPATDSGGIALTDLSVTTSSPLGTGALTYNNGTGVFNITMPDLSSYLTSTGAITSHTDVHTTAPTDGQILAWDNGNSRYRPITASGTGTVTSITAGTGLTGGTITASGTIALAANGVNDTHIDWGTGANQVSTADVPEQTNLYYTDARADARVAAGSINNVVEDTTPQLGGTLDANGNTIDMGTNVITDAKVGNYDTAVATMPNWNTAYTHSQAAHAPAGAEVNQNAFTTIAVSGQSNVVADAKSDTLTFVAGSNMTITTAAGSDTITLASSGGGGGIALTDLSVTTGSASGAGTLAYNNGTGVFTFQPADLSTYLTSTGVLSSHTDVHTAAPSGGNVLSWSASQSRWEPQVPQFTGFFGLTEEVVDTAADKIAFLDADNATKKESIADFLTAIAGTNLTAASGQLNASGGGGGGDTFKTIAVSGQTDVVADSSTDTLTLAAGSGMTITTTAGTDTITFAASGGGGSSSYTFTVNYSAGGTSIASISNLPSGWSSSIVGSNVTITHTANGQPMGISFYGLDKSASPDVWKYGYPTSTYPVTFPDSSETISTTEFTLNIGTSATGANTGTPFATSLAHIKVVF